MHYQSIYTSNKALRNPFNLPQLSKDAVQKRGELFNGIAEDEISQLSEGEKDDEEHESESGEVFGTARQRQSQLAQSRRKRNVFEDFDPGEEDEEGEDLVEQLGKTGQTLKTKSKCHDFIVRQYANETLVTNRL